MWRRFVWYSQFGLERKSLWWLVRYPSSPTNQLFGKHQLHWLRKQCMPFEIWDAIQSLSFKSLDWSWMFSILVLLNILHQLELGSWCVDLGHGTWGDFVDQLAQDLAITESILVRLLEFLTDNGFDPFLGLTLLSGIAFAGNLLMIENFWKSKSMFYSFWANGYGNTLAWTWRCNIFQLMPVVLQEKNSLVLRTTNWWWQAGEQSLK